MRAFAINYESRKTKLLRLLGLHLLLALAFVVHNSIALGSIKRSLCAPDPGRKLPALWPTLRFGLLFILFSLCVFNITLNFFITPNFA